MVGQRRGAGVAVATAVVAGFAAFAVAALLSRLVSSGMTQTYDTMLYGRSLWGIAHGQPFNPVYGMHWAGIHANVFLVLLAPLTLLMPSWSVLTVAQAVAFGATVALVLTAAAGAVPSRGWARALAFAWAFVAVAASPLLVNPFLFDARPGLLAVPFLVAAMLRADARDGWDGRAFAWLVAAALVREEFAVVGAAALLGFASRSGAAGTAAATRGARWGWRRRAAFAAGLCAWFGVYWWVVRPALGEGFAASRADQAATDLFAGAGADVGRFRILFAVALLSFGGGFALRGWRWLLAAVPGIVFVAATTKLAEYALNFHYAMFAAPALATASVAGLRDFAARRGTRGRTVELALGVALVIGAVSTVALGAHPLGRRFQAEHFGADPAAAPWQAECHALLSAIPPDDGAAVASMFGAGLADRPSIWSVETLTRHLADGGPVPDDVRWVAIDNNVFGTLGRVLVNRHGFQLVGIAAGRLALLERPVDPHRPPPVLRSVATAPRCTTVAVRWPEAGIALCDVRASEERVVGLLVRESAPPAIPPLAITAEVAGRPTVLEAVFGLVDPATVPVGVAVPVRSRDRVLAPSVRLHLQDLAGRNYAGVAGPGAAPTLGVDVPLGAPGP